jgi:hypothetical protein
MSYPSKTLLVLAFISLASAIIWASLQLPLWDGFAPVITEPWGFVALIDLYAGFVCFSVIIMWFEPRKSIALLLIVVLLCLGNLVSLLWLLWRGPELARQIKLSAEKIY